MSVGEQVRKYREIHHLTQEELADRVNVHVNTIRRWEGDKRSPDAGKLARLATALTTSVACLSGETKGSVLQGEKREGEEVKDRLIINNNDLHIDMPDRPESFSVIQRFFDWQLAKQEKNKDAAVPAV
ncbi:MAG: helix-turn-helix transcriptional regulator [Synergistaceae bacterium]|nr:helix-turn-helix transcriptional regulator [Synergistaceae bacterium]